MVVVREDIKKLGLIDSSTFCEECLEEASYRLRLGDQFCPCFEQSSGAKYKQFSMDQIADIVIPPFRSIFIETEEVIDLSSSSEIVARFDLRVKYALMGLLLQVGTQVQPGYRGRLFGNLFNTSTKEIKLKRYDKIMEIEFHYLSMHAIVKDSKVYLDLASCFNRHNINPSDYAAQSELDKLNKRLEKIDTQFSNCEDKHSRFMEPYKFKFGMYTNSIAIIVACVSLIITLIIGFKSCSNSEIEKETDRSLKASTEQIMIPQSARIDSTNDLRKGVKNE